MSPVFSASHRNVRPILGSLVGILFANPHSQWECLHSGCNFLSCLSRCYNTWNSTVQTRFGFMWSPLRDRDVVRKGLQSETRGWDARGREESEQNPPGQGHSRARALRQEGPWPMGGTGRAGASWVMRRRREEWGSQSPGHVKLRVHGEPLACLCEMRSYWRILTGEKYALTYALNGWW